MKREAVSAELVAAAKEVLKHSYSPYSRFPVGAAVLTRSGSIFAAPNIENASYGLTLCAERNAVFHAISAGERDISALVLYTPTSALYAPCGACRQVLAEFLPGDARIDCVAEGGAQTTFTVDALLPMKFTL
jgi:cytidine deaminase